MGEPDNDTRVVAPIGSDPHYEEIPVVIPVIELGMIVLAGSGSQRNRRLGRERRFEIGPLVEELMDIGVSGAGQPGHQQVVLLQLTRGDAHDPEGTPGVGAVADDCVPLGPEVSAVYFQVVFVIVGRVADRVGLGQAQVVAE
jgi:hypothetical protein